MNTNTMKKYYQTDIGARLTKEAISHYWWYKRSDMNELYHAYTTCSQSKVRAWDYCKRRCAELEGYGLKIISANTYRFSVGFIFAHPDTGELCFMYITADQERWYPLTEECLD